MNLCCALTVILLTLSSQVLLAQTDDPRTMQDGDFCFEWHCVDPYQKFSVSFTGPNGSLGNGGRTLRTHVDSTLKDGRHHGREVNGALVASLTEVAFKGRLKKGARGKFTFNGNESCQNCRSHSDYQQEEQEQQKRFLLRMGAPSSNYMDISVRESSPDVRWGFVINNRMGLLRTANGQYFLDSLKSKQEISFGIIKSDKPIEHEIGPATAFNRLDAYKKIAAKAYTGQLGEIFIVHGSLGHSSKGGHARSRQDASFESRPSIDHAPFLLHFASMGSSETHYYHSYEFEIIDVCQGIETTLGQALLLATRFDPLINIKMGDEISRTLNPGTVPHEAGDVPPGFRAITCRCKCCPENPKYVVAYSGTAPAWDLGDWHDNIMQGIPIVGETTNLQPEMRTSPQYSFALQYSDWVAKKYAKPMAYSGHSLGGGLASFTAAYNDTQGYCYNAAPLSSASEVLRRRKKRPDLWCTHVQAQLDPVSVGLEFLPLQNAEGQVFSVDGSLSGPFFLDHFMTSIGSRVKEYSPPRKFN